MSQPATSRHGHVLVVDDDPRNVKLLVRILESQGYRAEAAADGAEALERIGRDKPDLVLLDVMMPELDGYQVCRRLRADAATQDLPILLVTALNDTGDKVRGLDAGADDFLTKPIHRAELLARVRTHLRVKRLRDTVVQSHESLARQNQRLLALERLQEDLMNMLVHDLKSPLASLRLAVELVRGVDPLASGERLASFLGHVDGCASRIETMVQDILDVARMESAAVTLRLGRFSWESLVLPVVEQFRGASKGLRVELPVPDTAFVADPSLVSRVLQNLVANAVRMCDEEDEVAILVEREPQGACLVTIADRGPGVPPGMEEAIFDKFLSAEARRTGSSANHGLGLTFCRLAVQAHGGRIWVEERPGGGSLFRFRLPLLELGGKSPVPPPALVAAS